MHRATKESGLTTSADGSIARRTWSCCARPRGKRHVGLTNSAFSWKFDYEMLHSPDLVAPELACSSARVRTDCHKTLGGG
jgi:hypothetical protein